MSMSDYRANFEYFEYLSIYWTARSKRTCKSWLKSSHIAMVEKVKLTLGLKSKNKNWQSIKNPFKSEKTTYNKKLAPLRSHDCYLKTYPAMLLNQLFGKNYRIFLASFCSYSAEREKARIYQRYQRLIDLQGIIDEHAKEHPMLQSFERRKQKSRHQDILVSTETRRDDCRW